MWGNFPSCVRSIPDDQPANLTDIAGLSQMCQNSTRHPISVPVNETPPLKLNLLPQLSVQ